MDDSRKKERKTQRVLTVKRLLREKELKAKREVDDARRQREEQSFEKEKQTAWDKGNEKMKRSLKLYDKLFKEKPGEVREDRRRDSRQAEHRQEDGENDQAAQPKQHRLSREEFLKQKKEREFRQREKQKFKALYGRKTQKGQPIMKHRINHLLSKIKMGIKKPN